MICRLFRTLLGKSSLGYSRLREQFWHALTLLEALTLNIEAQFSSFDFIVALGQYSTLSNAFENFDLLKIVQANSSPFHLDIASLTSKEKEEKTPISFINPSFG